MSLSFTVPCEFAFRFIWKNIVEVSCKQRFSISGKQIIIFKEKYYIFINCIDYYKLIFILIMLSIYTIYIIYIYFFCLFHLFKWLTSITYHITIIIRRNMTYTFFTHFYIYNSGSCSLPAIIKIFSKIVIIQLFLGATQLPRLIADNAQHHIK